MIECPTCGALMISRKNGESGQRFWGCSKYPTCKGTRDTDGEPPRRRTPAWDTDGADYSRESDLPSDRARRNDRRRW